MLNQKSIGSSPLVTPGSNLNASIRHFRCDMTLVLDGRTRICAGLLLVFPVIMGLVWNRKSTRIMQLWRNICAREGQIRSLHIQG